MRLRKLEKNMLEQGYVSIRMAALKLGRSENTIRNMIDDKRLKAAMALEQLWVTIASIEDYLGPATARKIDWARYEGTDMGTIIPLPLVIKSKKAH